jgi:hypothetical protein
MNPTDISGMRNRLLNSGWKTWEAEKLFNFLMRYKQTSMDLPDLTFDMRKLAFLRYLVQTARLSD